MKKESMKDRPYVTVDLPFFLQDFLAHEFKDHPSEDGLVVDGGTDVGRYILSLVTAAREPEPVTADHPLRLYLPLNAEVSYGYRHLTPVINGMRGRQLWQHLNALFRLRVREFFAEGYRKGFSQDSIIRAFLEHYACRHNAMSYDAVKQADFRYRRKLRRQIAAEITESVERWA